MNYAIIAAGEGSRLAQEGIVTPKPLVKVNNERLIDRLIHIFMDHDADQISVICNALTSDVSRHLMHIEEEVSKEDLSLWTSLWRQRQAQCIVFMS